MTPGRSSKQRSPAGNRISKFNDLVNGFGQILVNAFQYVLASQTFQPKRPNWQSLSTDPRRTLGNMKASQWAKRPCWTPIRGPDWMLIDKSYPINPIQLLSGRTQAFDSISTDHSELTECLLPFEACRSARFSDAQILRRGGSYRAPFGRPRTWPVQDHRLALGHRLISAWRTP